MGEIRLDYCCRLCLKEGFSLTNIFSHRSAAGDPLYRILSFIYDIKIFENDGFPSQICSPCMWRMIEFDACKKNVHSAEAEILKLMSQTTHHSNKVSNDGLRTKTAETEKDQASESVEVGIEHGSVHSEIPIKREIDLEEWEMPVETVMKVPEICRDFAEGDGDDYHELESTEAGPVEVAAQAFEEKCNEQVICQPLREGPDMPEARSSMYLNEYEGVVENASSEELCIDRTQGRSVVNDVSKGMQEKVVRDAKTIRKWSVSAFEPKRNKDVPELELNASKSNLCSRRKEYICDVCKKSFPEKYKLRQHVRVHYDDKLYSCCVCGKRFKQDRGRKLHELGHMREESNCGESKSGSTEKLYSCGICEKQFGVKSSLDEHLNVHSKKYSCHSCGKSFGCLSHLKVHSRIHSKERPFECQVCLKRFTQKAVLNQHMAYHSSERPFSCSLCDKKFKTKKDKSQHELLHYRKK